MKFNYLSFNPDVLGGKPCITGTRISVELILELIASGATIEKIVATYPQLTEAAVKEALFYTTEFMKNEINIELSKVA